MPQSNLETDIRTCIESFIGELTILVQQAALESVQEALGGMATPARRGPGRPRKVRPGATTHHGSGKRIRRSTASVEATAQKAAGYIATNPGCTIGDIGTAMSLSSKDLRLPIKKLLDDGKIKTTGQKRGTRYHPGSGGTRRKASKKKAGRKKTAKRKTSRGKNAGRTKKPSRRLKG